MNIDNLDELIIALEDKVKILTETLDEYGELCDSPTDLADYKKRKSQINQINTLIKKLKYGTE